MGRTQDEVIAELDHQGIAVNERRLTDWRQKGLLPELEEVRDAHGRVSYAWNQTNIVEQVKTVAELFAFYGRANRFAHVLWLLGYEVRSDLVMEGIRALIVGLWQIWSGGASADEQLFDEEQVELLRDTIGELAIRIARRRERRPEGLPNFQDASDHVFRAMSVMLDPMFPPEEVISEFAALSKTEVNHDASSDAAMTQTIALAQRHLTPRRLAEVASTATWEEFCEAGVDFGILRDTIAVFMLHQRTLREASELDLAAWMALRNGALSNFGPWIIVSDMALRRAGYGHGIRVYLRLLRQKLVRFDWTQIDAQNWPQR